MKREIWRLNRSRKFNKKNKTLKRMKSSFKEKKFVKTVFNM